MTRAIIVGSGMAGLTAGAYLARAGCEVEVYEQADHIGGVTHTLRKNGFAWDLGPMMAEGFGPGEPAGRVLAELGCADRVQFIRGDRTFSFPDFRISPPAEYQGPYWRREFFKQIFPHEADGLDRYYRFYDMVVNLMALTRRAEDGSFPQALLAKLRMLPMAGRAKQYMKWSAQDLMDHFFTDPKLKAVFTTILADLTVRPSEFISLGIPVFNPENSFDRRIPTRISSAGPRLASQFAAGGWGSLVEALAGVIRESGGKLHTSRSVARIVLKGDRARGIELAGGERVEADLVLVSGAASECFLKLIGRDALPGDLATKVEGFPLMESVFMVHLGVDMDPSAHQEAILNYYYRTYEIEEGIAHVQNGDYHEGKDGFLIYVPSMHSPGMAPPGQHAITIYTIAPNKLAGGWETRRQEMVDKLLDEAEREIPGLREHARVVVSLTPEDFGRLTQMPDHHSFGGLRPVMGMTGAPHRTPFEGLWFIGAQSESGATVNGVLLGARKACKMIGV
ncbi:MAG: NAD(P)/FAD-dependent oxidoreductase [Actinomycetota bacterium]